MLNYNLKIGLLPIRRYIKEPPKRYGIFQSDYAVENKEKCIKYIRDHFTDEKTTFVDIDFLNEEGVLLEEKMKLAGKSGEEARTYTVATKMEKFRRNRASEIALRLL